jgi:hypothetical protein
VRLEHGRRGMATVALVGAFALLAACEPRQMPQADGTAHPGQQPDPAAQGRVVSLTGCLTPGDTPGEFTLASVATAGVLPGTGEPRDDGRDYTVDRPAASPEDQAALVAGSSYRVIPTDDVREDLREHLNQRVTLVGRVAPDVPQHGAAGQDAGQGQPGAGQAGQQQGQQAQGQAGQQQGQQLQGQVGQPGATGTTGQAPTEATVVAQPPTLRGFYVHSVRHVADTCAGGN